jgi:hypothetical protein
MRDCHIYIYMCRLRFFPNGCAGLSYVAFYYIFANSKEYPKEANDSAAAKIPETGFFFPDPQKFKDNWHNLRSNCMREIRKSKEKISGNGATVKGKWSYYYITYFLEYY